MRFNIGAVLLLILFAWLWFFNIGHVNLMNPDEARYAQIPLEMVTSGDYITPRLNEIKYFEKPVLHYWATAFFYNLFGASETTARLWTLLQGFLCVLSVFLFGRHFWSRERGLLAALILVSSVFYITLSHLNILDMGLTFFLTLTFLSSMSLVHPDLTRKEKQNANLIFWMSLALGVLTKGLVALLLPGLVLFIYMVVQRNLQFIKNLNWIWGPLLFFMIVAPWFVLVGQKNPEFFQFFFIHEHFERFLTKTHHREGPFWYFIPIIIGGFFPWLLVAFNFKDIDLDLEAKNRRNRLMLILWSGVTFIFFSVSSSKLAPYILPIFPALALLTAEWVERSMVRSFRIVMGGFTLFALVGIAASQFLKNHQAKFTSNETFQDLSHSLLICSVVFLIALLLQWFLKNRWSDRIKFVFVSLSALLYFQCLLWNYDHLAESLSSFNTATAAQPFVNAQTPVYAVEMYEPGLTYYLKHPLILVNYAGELQFGLKQDPRLSVASRAEFEKIWTNTDEQAVAIFTPYTFRLLTENGMPMKKVYEDLRRVVVIRKD